MPQRVQTRRQVSWSGVTAPTNADGIALYVNAPNTTVNTLSPLRWQWANRSPGYALASGGYSSSGSLVCAGPPDQLQKSPCFLTARPQLYYRQSNMQGASASVAALLWRSYHAAAETPRV